MVNEQSFIVIVEVNEPSFIHKALANIQAAVDVYEIYLKSDHMN